jgi:predicted dehydrogenase
MSDVRAGVIGVGSMGRHHARVYSELLDVELVGVCDVDPEQAVSVADEYGADPLGAEELLETVDVVSIAVPTRFHYENAMQCIDAGVHVLVEKPFVADPEEGRELIHRAREADVCLQVGHVERFNPAVRALGDVLEDEDDEILTVSAERLGPPLDRTVEDPVTKDLMIHDVDVVLSLLGDYVEEASAVTSHDGQYTTATLGFAGGCVGRLTASRITHEKVRRLHVGTETRRIKVDYIDQSVRIRRRSRPEFVEDDGDVRYHHEGVVEEVAVDSTEPLKAELRSFVDAALEGTEPVVTGEDALDVLEVIERIEAAAATEDHVTDGIPQ